MPATGMPSGAATTQPMVMPRGTSPGLKPTRPTGTGSTRSTQRIVLPTAPPGTRPNSTRPLAMGGQTGRINLPMGMILRCLPPEVLASDLSEYEASGAAATEIGLPMNMILGQLPSGKVEMTLQDLVPHFPPGYLQPTESISSYLPNTVNLPLMDVVMRIPPDLLALRPDQKDVDASVINMADPFTEEILREQAEAARRAAQPNIIEESQAPQEEFVPRDHAAMAKAVVPPSRLAPSPAAAPAPLPTSSPPTSSMPPPMPPAARLPTPAALGGLRSSAPTPPVIPSASARTISPTPSGQMIPPTRATTAIPTRPQGQVTSQIQATPPAPSTPPVPPAPRLTGSVPAPPAPRHTASLPTPRRTASLPTPSGTAASFAATTPMAPIRAEMPAPVAPTPPAPVAPPAAVPTAPATDDLQRLAALAMQQLGDEDIAQTAAEPEPAAEAPAPVVEPEPAPEPLVEPEVAPPVAEVTPAPTPAAPEPAPMEAQPSGHVAFNLNTCTAEELVQNIPGCFPDLAESIIQHRQKIGSFKRLEDLLDVPGITKAAYTNLTGEQPPENRIPLSLNELLGFPGEQHISLKDVTDRIACWPDVTGCVLSQSTGLSLVGTVPDGMDKSAIVAFAPRMFEAINKSLAEVAGKETDALILPLPGTSFHIFRNKNLYLIILSRLPQMPERHMKVARFVLSALSIRRD